MESTVSHSNAQNPLVEAPASAADHSAPKATTILFWVFTVLFCLEMSFTAYYELTSQGTMAFNRLGFHNGSFRFELSFAKLAGVVALLVPMRPARLNAWIKEWAYAGFAINLVSAVIAHLSISDRLLAFVPSTLTSVLWAISYFSWRRLQNARTNSFI